VSGACLSRFRPFPSGSGHFHCFASQSQAPAKPSCFYAKLPTVAPRAASACTRNGERPSTQFQFPSRCRGSAEQRPKRRRRATGGPVTVHDPSAWGLAPAPATTIATGYSLQQMPSCWPLQCQGDAWVRQVSAADRADWPAAPCVRALLRVEKKKDGYVTP